MDRTITLVRDDGKEIVADILFTYKSEEFNKDYVVFQVRESGEISAASYTETDSKNGELNKIETEEEWALLEDLLDDYANQGEDNESCSGVCSGCAHAKSCSSCEEYDDTEN